MNDKPDRMPNVPPFVKFVASAVPMVFDNSLSYYEALCALWKYVQSMTDVINNNATLEEEYIEKFNELKTFVDTYFDNLDVQEEINNKLDAMAEDGTLQEIITAYIQSNVAWTFDTVADMKSATNLTSSSYAQTLGYHSYDDGGGALYKIRTITADDVIDEGSIIAITGTSLIAELIVLNGIVVPEMFGAYGDGTHDDILSIRSALKYLLSSDANVSTWQLSGELHLLDKSYLIGDSIVDNTFPTGGATRIAIKGNGTRSAIIASPDCSIVLNNLDKIGFSNFENINFIGNDNTFLFENGATPQRLRFIRCVFDNFHMIADIEGTLDNSEFVFDQCAITHCGSSENPCELFKFNNSQMVNWRFYATDIEVFIGTCFHFLKGININYFQGSIIPSQDSLIFDYTDAVTNTFGGGNSPTANMYGVRYELRTSRLIEGGSFPGRIIINHYGCGMGGQNIGAATDTIKITHSILKLNFFSCYNFENYMLNLHWSRSVAENAFNDGYIKFEDCQYNVIEDMIGRSTIDATAPSYYNMLPSIFFDGQQINGVSNTNLAKYSGQILTKTVTNLTGYRSLSDSAGVKTFLPRAGFITSVTLESSYTTSYGNIQLTAEVYNDSGTLIGTGSINVQGRSSATIQVNAPVTKEWYILLKNSNGNSWPVPHIIYAEYLS